MKAAIFDLDGTLVDSMGMWRELERNFLISLGIEPAQWIFQRMDTLGLHGSADWLIQEFSLNRSAQELWNFCDTMALDGYLKSVFPKPGALRMVRALHARGVKTALATLTAHKLADRVVEARGFLPLLDHLLTVEDVNGVKKDRPDLFLKAASLLGAAPHEVVVFEDSLYAIRTAVKAGFPVWSILDSESSADHEEIRSLSTRCFESWETLADELEAQFV